MGRVGQGSLAVAVTVGLAVLAAGPAARADQKAYYPRNPNGDRASHRNPNADESSRRQYGDPSTGGDLPAEFVAEQDGRLVVVSAATGQVTRRLTPDAPGGGASHPAVAPDGRTVWFSRADGTCAAHLAWVPAAGGRERGLPGSGEEGPETTPLPRPGHDQVAYARADCQSAQTTLVVGDLKGLRAYGQSGLVPLAWSADGDHLLARAADRDERHLLDVDTRGAIADDHPLAPADRAAGCQVQVLGFSPGDSDGYVAARRCDPSSGEARRSLVLLDRAGRLRSTVVRLARGQAFLGAPVFDPSGHSLLFSAAPVESGAGTDDVSLWLWRDGNTRRLARGNRYLDPAWLP